jgi:cellulose synthase/poly-beta-1,6-N-acetylglucosamine synthase-like glycosyltransferase
MSELIVLLLFGWYALAVIWYWIPLVATLYRRRLTPPAPVAADSPLPLLIAIAPCRGGAAAIPGMVACLKSQNYPASQHRQFILIDRDGENDPSAEIARAAGAELFERRDAVIKTKGAAVNELLQRLKDKPWDAVLILDIDVRLDPDFLRRTAAYILRGDAMIQAAPVSKSAGASVSRLSHVAQLLSQMVQHGRQVLGLPAILSGSCMVISRDAAEQLHWQTSTGKRLSDDGELNLRCLLAGIPVSYAPDLQVLNDQPQDHSSVRLQRRRWFVTHLEGLIYVWPLLRKGLEGSWRALEGLFTFSFLPGSSLSFAAASLTLVYIALQAFLIPGSGGNFSRLFMLWALHALYYVVALRVVGGELTREELRQIPAFLWTRAAAIWDGMILGTRRNPGEHSVPFKPSANPAEERPGEHSQDGGDRGGEIDRGVHQR